MKEKENEENKKRQIENEQRYNFNSLSYNNNCIINLSRPSYIFEYTTINENHLQFEYVVFLMYNSNMAKGR